MKRKGLSSPIWWFRGHSNLHITRFIRLTDSKMLMNNDEIEIKKIVAYGAREYYKKFVYVEACPEKSTGVYGEISEKEINKRKKISGEYHEEFAIFNGINIKREEYDDDAAVIDGKVIDLENKAEVRIRYLTPYNFIICAQINPINQTKNDSILKELLNGVLEGKNTVDDIINYVNTLTRHRKDI